MKRKFWIGTVVVFCLSMISVWVSAEELNQIDSNRESTEMNDPQFNESDFKFQKQMLEVLRDNQWIDQNQFSDGIAQLEEAKLITDGQQIVKKMTEDNLAAKKYLDNFYKIYGQVLVRMSELLVKEKITPEESDVYLDRMLNARSIAELDKMNKELELINNKFVKAQTSRETKRKIERAERLKKEAAVKKKAANRKKMRIILGGISIVILVIAGFLYGYSLRKNQGK
ncbi:hypothetical protein [Vagococcus silagei]|uniref:Uncharacterized protein n=1 Tax=Vagococcus silagei TaxID=2508885 RepID=A0A4S3B7S6_9ENTE|nr:hypothetical protein [Vagococcus silagei]THB62110.1 hypothetical protein ESZ54_02570 [Vagococcus silagei]